MAKLSHNSHRALKLPELELSSSQRKEFLEALSKVSADMDVFEASRLSIVLETVYDQGKRDGAQLALEAVEKTKSKLIS